MRSQPEFEGLDFRHFFLQPMDGPERDRNTRTGGAVLHGASEVAAESADAQAAGDSVKANEGHVYVGPAAT